MRVYNHRYRQLMPAARKYYYGIERSWSFWRGSEFEYFCRVPNTWFKVAYQRAYTTHRRIIDPEIESRLAELEALLLRPGYYEIGQQGQN